MFRIGLPGFGSVLLLAVCVASSADELGAANAAADVAHSNGKTALMQAARSGDEAAVERLLRIGADVNRTNTNGGTPLMYAMLGVMDRNEPVVAPSPSLSTTSSPLEGPRWCQSASTGAMPSSGQRSIQERNCRL